MMISFYRVRDNAMSPEKAYPADGGYDVFYCPDLQQISQTKGKNIESWDINSSSGPQIVIKPGGNAILSTGLKIGIQYGYILQMCNRGSMAAKRSLIVGAHIIDSNFKNEIFVDLHNIGTEPQTILPGDKIAQFIILPVMMPIPMEAANEDSLYNMFPITIEGRNEKMLGSSGA